MEAIKELKEKAISLFGPLIFDEKRHLYFVKEKRLTSVSSVYKNFVKQENWDLIAKRTAKSRGVSLESIKKEWEDKRVKSASHGTEVHDFAENYGKNLVSPDEAKGDPKKEAAIKFYSELPPHIQPVFFELRMFHSEYNYAGTCDLVLYDSSDNTIILADYKTNIDLFKNFKEKKLLPPFEYLLDNPFNHYQIQLSLYELLLGQLEHPVKERWVIWLKKDGDYTKFKTHDFKKELIVWLNDKWRINTKGSISL